MTGLPAQIFGICKSVGTSVFTWVLGAGRLYVAMGALGLGGLAVVYGLMQMSVGSGEVQTIDVVEGQFFEIATGPVTGTYYPLGNAIASVISNPAGSVRCIDETRCGPPGLIAVVQTSAGSVENVEALHSGRVHSAFAQANVVNSAYRPSDASLPSYDGLRAISGLYTEVIHLVVLQNSDIQVLGDLRGHRVSVDRPGSGTFGITQQILTTQGISARNTELLELSADQATERLVNGEIDAFFFVAGPPVRAVAELANAYPVRLIPIEGPAVDELVSAEPYLTSAQIDEGAYRDTTAVQTIGVPALWIVDRDADYETVYRITSALWNPANRPMLEEGPLQAHTMQLETALDGVPIPFHPGASAFYREIGLFPSE